MAPPGLAPPRQTAQRRKGLLKGLGLGLAGGAGGDLARRAVHTGFG